MQYAVIEWRNEQPYSPEFDDIYFSSEGGRDESSYVFLQQNGLPGRWLQKQQFVIGETGFGTGLNFVLTLQQWLQRPDDGSRLHYLAIEKHPVSPGDIRRISRAWPELETCFDALLRVYPLPVAGRHTRTLFDGRVTVHFAFMDVRQALQACEISVDAWYLDGFGPSKNPAMWNQPVFSLLAQNSAQGASLSTFTCAGDVRRGLSAAGFVVSKVPGFGSKREMITAFLQNRTRPESTAPWYDRPVSRFDDKSAVIVGAGIAGLTTAWSLAQRGWNVTLLDRHAGVAQEASGNPAGLVLPRLSAADDVDTAFYSSAFLYAVHRLDQLQQHAEEKFWFKTGVYLIDAGGKTEKIIHSYDYPEQYMTIPGAGELPGYLSAKAGQVAWLPSAGWVQPHSLCEMLVHACGDALAIHAADVCRLERVGSSWNIVDHAGSTLVSAEVVIIASGIGANRFEQTSWLPVSAVRGQVTMIPVSETSVALEHALSFEAYVTPQHNGLHCAGATFSRTDTTPDLLQADQDKNFSRLEQTLPGMFTRPGKLQGRVGFRAVSPDRVPVVGAVPDHGAFEGMYAELHHGRTGVEYPSGSYLDGLYVTAAHGSRGLSSSFLSAEIIAAMIENAPLPVDRQAANHLNPARFIVRRLRRNPGKIY